MSVNVVHDLKAAQSRVPSEYADSYSPERDWKKAWVHGELMLKGQLWR